MRRTTALPELLAPAGNFEALIAAVEAGADAVYLGGKSFGARAFAENFDINELSRAVEYAHLFGVKLFVTVNTLIYDRELDAMRAYLRELYKIGVDAIIASDLGVIREIRRTIPDMKIHASTQMSIHNTDGAKIVHSLCAERVVVARELPLCELKSVVENSPVYIEYFLHGALCVCHSGQCLFSSLVGGRSGNRGECAQPCRLPFNGDKYPLSLSELSLANHVKELVESGVASLKIEGRMKSPSYVYNVTRIYRRLLDENRNVNEKENIILKNTFSRSGFTDGYFVNNKFAKMTGVRSEDDKKKTRELEARSFEIEKIPLSADIKIHADKPVSLTLTIKKTGKSKTVYGAVPNVANTSPLSIEGVKERVMKMGGTVFSLADSDVCVSLDEGLNLPPSALNALRRDAVERLCSQKRELSESTLSYTKLRKKTKRLNTALFLSAKEFEKYKNKDSFFDICFLPIEYFEDKSTAPERVGVYIPPVIFDGERERVISLLKRAEECGVKHALITNLSNIELLRDFKFEITGDFRLNISNSESARELMLLSVERFILHPEITLPMARDIGGGVIVYGRIPLMLTERCFIKENYGCDKCNAASLTDRRGARFPLMYEFGHRNLILNSALTYMADKQEELDKAALYHRHFIFSTESAREIESVVSAFKTGKAPAGNQIRRIGIVR